MSLAICETLPLKPVFSSFLQRSLNILCCTPLKDCLRDNINEDSSLYKFCYPPATLGLKLLPSGSKNITHYRQKVIMSSSLKSPQMRRKISAFKAPCVKFFSSLPGSGDILQGSAHCACMSTRSWSQSRPVHVHFQAYVPFSLFMFVSIFMCIFKLKVHVHVSRVHVNLQKHVTPIYRRKCMIDSHRRQNRFHCQDSEKYLILSGDDNILSFFTMLNILSSGSSPDSIQRK